MQIADTRWLVFDRREEMAEKPGTHALVMGVSAYQYLPDKPEETDSRRTFGLHRLAVAARSAYVFHNWLKNNADRVATPLKTLRLLLAPHPSELNEIEDLDHSRAECGFEDFLSAAYAWREDASDNPEDATVFYFCGNGFDLGPSNPVIALADFGASRSPLLRGTVAVNHLIQGLAPSDDVPRVARTQLYFIDSGRRRVSFDESASVVAPPVFDLPRPWLDDRRMAVCHASSPGERAWAVLGGTTFFLVGLMRCLQGAAAVPEQGGFGPSRNRPGWKVTVNSLVEALPDAVKHVVDEAGAPEQRVFVSSKSGDAVLVQLDVPPVVPVTVEFDPEEASGRAVFEITKADGSPVDVSEGGRTPGHRELILPAGIYLVRISFRPAASDATSGPPEKDLQFISSLMPPRAVWSVKAEP